MSTSPTSQVLHDLDDDASETPSPTEKGVQLNGIHDSLHLDPLQKLQLDLDKTRDEKEALATQYRNLLTKLTTMRTTLGNKLKQDAEELDRQSQLVQSLTTQNSDLTNSLQTIRTELLSSHTEASQLSQELSVLRSKSLYESNQESHQLQSMQLELERIRLERDEWEQMYLREKVIADEGTVEAEGLARELAVLEGDKETLARELVEEREKVGNLQEVLEDFQNAKDHELRIAVKEYEERLDQATQSLAEFKSRALNAEVKLDESRADTSRTQDLEKEVKEKNLLIGKIRHEAVIINEHLIEALRRLRATTSTTATSVDARLITNILLQFLATERGDPKKWEILGLMGTVLGWGEGEREKAGLKRGGGGGLPNSARKAGRENAGSSSPTATGLGGWLGRSTGSASTELEKTDETESFSRLWVEFLLTESSSESQSNSIPPPVGSPTRDLHSPLGSGPVSRSASRSASDTPPRRLSSFTGLGTPSSVSKEKGKGKEKEIDGS